MPLPRSRLTGALPFYVLAAYLAVVFFTGGSARADTLSLLVLRPLSAVICGLALVTLPLGAVRHYRTLFILLAAAALLVVLHLIPLPPSIWASLPGRDLVVEIDRTVGIQNAWRPLTLVPAGAWNALYSLLVPLAVLLLAVQVGPKDQAKLMLLFIALGCVSSILALLQLAGPVGGSFYLYAVTNAGTAVGLFANRNHTAAFLACLFPMLAYVASTGTPVLERQRFRLVSAVAIGVFLMAMLIVTGSRAGIIGGVIAIVLAILIYRHPLARSGAHRRPARRLPSKRLLAGAALAGAVALIFMSFSRAQAIERLFAADHLDDLRFQVWGPIASLGWNFFPFGSGIGSFVETYQVVEAREILRPSYLNHAHNDWLELFLTGGAPALLLALAAAIGVVWRSWTLWVTADSARDDILRGRVASIVLLVLALVSITDYPLRTPSITALAVIAAVWLHRPRPDGNAA